MTKTNNTRKLSVNRHKANIQPELNSDDLQVDNRYKRPSTKYDADQILEMQNQNTRNLKESLQARVSLLKTNQKQEDGNMLMRMSVDKRVSRLRSSVSNPNLHAGLLEKIPVGLKSAIIDENREPLPKNGPRNSISNQRKNS